MQQRAADHRMHDVREGKYCGKTGRANANMQSALPPRVVVSGPRSCGASCDQPGQGERSEDSWMWQHLLCWTLWNALAGWVRLQPGERHAHTPSNTHLEHIQRQASLAEESSQVAPAGDNAACHVKCAGDNNAACP